MTERATGSASKEHRDFLFLIVIKLFKNNYVDNELRCEHDI